ncbi:hypothetical protein B0H10DRAFT_2030797 [Mycena sp. CBHHK59/15]|nr:hypothetical protein B0H10DRAFT_2030797 [Mycena sp. CBHHK59/15]
MHVCTIIKHAVAFCQSDERPRDGAAARARSARNHLELHVEPAVWRKLHGPSPPLGFERPRRTACSHFPDLRPACGVYTLPGTVDDRSAILRQTIPDDGVCQTLPNMPLRHRGYTSWTGGRRRWVVEAAPGEASIQVGKRRRTLSRETRSRWKDSERGTEEATGLSYAHWRHQLCWANHVHTESFGRTIVGGQWHTRAQVDARRGGKLSSTESTQLAKIHSTFQNGGGRMEDTAPTAAKNMVRAAHALNS